MTNVVKRALSAIEPWYNWGSVTVERLDAVSEDHGNEGDVSFFDLQWFGLHLSFQIGRTPAKATPEQIASRVRYRIERAEQQAERDIRREAWEAAHRAYLNARALFDATPLDDSPQEVALLDAWCDALDHLIENAPAPDGKALATKLELIGDRAFNEKWIPAFAADARRLHAEGY